MNVNEWGVHAVFSTGFDMRGYTALSMIFVKPDGTELIVTNPDVTVGSMDINTAFGLFPANRYLSYTTKPGDIDQVGGWEWRVTYLDSSQYLTSDIATFTIYE